MPDAPVRSRPLLTLAIPTYNRAAVLNRLLTLLLPQVAEFPEEVQLIVSDNGSPDNTAEIISRQLVTYTAAGVPFETLRHESNVGPDANFLGCFNRASGSFFWICGDDDIIVPDALALVLSHLRGPDGGPAEIDLVYATGYAFREDYLAEQQHDPCGRVVHTITDVHRFVTVVNIMFTFVSGMIINKDRLECLKHEDPSEFVGTFLIQISWVLPLLMDFRKGLVLWTRPVAGRQGHANGYSLGKVFGGGFVALLHRLLPGRADLSQPIINFALRRWFPALLLDMRANVDPTLRFEEAPIALRAAYGSNPRFWIFTWPVLTLPMPLARLWQKGGAAISKLVYVAHVPDFWRKRT